MLAVGNKGRQLSRKLLEQGSLKDSARLSEDLKLLLSQISAARGVDLTLNDMSPRVSENGEESRSSDASISIGIQTNDLEARIDLHKKKFGGVLNLENMVESITGVGGGWAVRYNGD
ncbi:unnamed protein product [Ilex paraguariensis]|uniref:Uncharacterized protein n=1 Tax=Ilex paraguariensis TaxID=185542 RepID=A0ABC8UFR5_9AQUA